MGRWILGLVVAVVLASLVGCAGRRLPTLDARGFRHARLEYRIDRAPDGSLVGEEWTIDNLRLGSDGAAAAYKVGPDYRVRRHLDADGDGDVEAMPEIDAYDLRFRHRRDAGVIWVRTVTLPRSLRDTELRVLMRYYVDGIAGGGVSLTDLGGGSVIVEERRFATREVVSEPLVVAGREALAATIEVANVDQLELSRDAVWERARVVFVRTDLMWTLNEDLFDAEFTGPVLMMIGYSNLPEDFDAHLVEFEGLLSRVVFETPETDAARPEALACFPQRDIVPLLVERYGVVSGPDGYDPCLQQVADARDLEAQHGYGFRRPEAMRAAPTPPAASPEPVPESSVPLTSVP